MQALRVLGLLMILANGIALGHGNTRPLHGGVVQMVGEKSFELVTNPAGAELYVVDDGDDVDSATMSARLTVDTAGIKSELAMQAAGGNKFVAKGAKISSGAKVVVTLIAADQSKTTARFTIK